jgi:hypothetical protein
MKIKVPPAVAATVLVIAAAGICLLGWKWAAAAGGNQSDVRPILAVMNAGKPETEAIPPEIAQGDALMMGSQKPKKSTAPVKSSVKPKKP